MKSIRLSLSLLCMGLAGCSLPFFGQKDAEKKVASVEMEEQLVGEEVRNEVVIPVIEENIEIEKVVKEKEVIEIVEPEMVITAQDLRVSIFDELKEVIQSEKEKEKLEEKIIVGMADKVVEMVISEETQGLAPQVVINVKEKVPEVGKILSKEEESLKSLDEELRELELLLDEVVPVVVGGEKLEIIEESAMETLEVVLPEGAALPSTGGTGPLATLWGWVKSWF